MMIMKIQLDENTVVYRPDKPSKTALKQLYDVLNEINAHVHKNEYFYTDEEVEELKKDPRNVWL